MAGACSPFLPRAAAPTDDLTAAAAGLGKGLRLPACTGGLGRCAREGAGRGGPEVLREEDPELQQ